MVVAVPLQVLIFLYTVMDKVLSDSGLKMVSKNGMAPSSLVSSTVSLMAGSTLLMHSRKFCLCSFYWMIKVSSTYLNQILGGWRLYLGFFAQTTPCTGWPLWGLLGNPWLSIQPVCRTDPEKQSKYCVGRTLVIGLCPELVEQSCPLKCYLVLKVL